MIILISEKHRIGSGSGQQLIISDFRKAECFVARTAASGTERKRKRAARTVEMARNTERSTVVPRTVLRCRRRSVVIHPVGHWHGIVGRSIERRPYVQLRILIENRRALTGGASRIAVVDRALQIEVGLVIDLAVDSPVQTETVAAPTVVAHIIAVAVATEHVALSVRGPVIVINAVVIRAHEIDPYSLAERLIDGTMH